MQWQETMLLMCAECGVVFRRAIAPATRFPGYRSFCSVGCSRASFVRRHAKASPRTDQEIEG